MPAAQPVPIVVPQPRSCPVADTPEPSPASQPAPRKATLREVVGAVFWSFFGVRKGAAMRRDAVTIRPYQVVLVGVRAGIGFVLTLLVLVRLILRFAAS